MSNIFTYRDDYEGNVGIGKLPKNLQNILENISEEYIKIIPNKNNSVYHTWFNDMPENIKKKVEQIQKDIFWDKLCDNTKNV
jgi:hypothetical protein